MQLYYKWTSRQVFPWKVFEIFISHTLKNTSDQLLLSSIFCTVLVTCNMLFYLTRNSHQYFSEDGDLTPNFSLNFALSQKMLLTLSWWRLISYRKQSVDMRSRSMDWFLYDIGLHHERVKVVSCEYSCKIKCKYFFVVKK